jgi:hypothetical protein
MMLKESFMKSMKFGLVAISSLGLFLTSCPEVSNEIGTIRAKYSKIGVVGLRNAGTYKVFTGVFYSVPVGIYQPSTGTDFAEDTCIVTKNPGNPYPPGANQNKTSLDAGKELTIKTVVPTVLKAQILNPTPGFADNQKIYVSGPSATSPDTSGVTLEVPGVVGGFPAMTTSLPNELVAFTFGPKTGITKNTIFKWTTPTSGAFVTIGASSGLDPSRVFVACVVKDDGEFVFPASVKTELDKNGFTTGSADADKSISRYSSNGDALLIVANARASNP